MQKTHSIDIPLLLTVFLLIAFGMVMISSVSVYSSFKLTSSQVAMGLLDEPNNSFYLAKHIQNAILAIVLIVAVAQTPIRIFEKYAKYIFPGTLFLLLLAFIPWIGVKYNGARGWLDFPGIPSIQPVEFVKIGLILYLAYFLKKRYSRMTLFQKWFIPYFSIFLLVAIPLALLPDFWSILIITPLVIALYFVGGGNVRYIIVSIVIACVGALGVYLIGKSSTDPDNPSKFSYISARIDRFMRNAEDVALSKDTAGDYQLQQWLIAIGSAGMSGLGFWRSIQKFGYLPEAQGDFIFSIIIEEWWFYGAIFLIAAYLFIIHRGYMIARWFKDPFAYYTAFGISTLIGIQAMVNIGVNLNVIPLTGITLPFVSYGGSSLLSLIIGVGILLALSRQADYDLIRQTNFSIFGSRNAKRIVHR